MHDPDCGCWICCDAGMARDEIADHRPAGSIYSHQQECRCGGCTERRNRADRPAEEDSEW